MVKLVVLSRENIVLIMTLKSNYQFAVTNIIIFFNVAIKPLNIFLQMEKKFIEIYKMVGNSIRNKRKEKGLTQQQLADKDLKLDRAKISDIENGKEDFHFFTLLKICEALDMNIKEVFIDKE
jgi:DNA-binding XRE family transcriptional regulator